MPLRYIFYLQSLHFEEHLSVIPRRVSNVLDQYQGRFVRTKVNIRRQKSPLARKELWLSLADFPWPQWELNNFVF